MTAFMFALFGPQRLQIDFLFQVKLTVQKWDLNQTKYYATIMVEKSLKINFYSRNNLSPMGDL